MKRLITLATTLLALTAVPFALASAGPGRFQSTITGKGARTEKGKLDGTWAINLSSYPSGKTGLSWQGHPAGGGRYVISGSTITFTPKKHGSCKSNGKYTFHVDSGRLTFTPIRDTCTTRRDILTYGTWVTTG